MPIQEKQRLKIAFNLNCDAEYNEEEPPVRVKDPRTKADEVVAMLTEYADTLDPPGVFRSRQKDYGKDRIVLTGSMLCEEVSTAQAGAIKSTLDSKLNLLSLAADGITFVYSATYHDVD